MFSQSVARSVVRFRRLWRWLATEDYLYAKVLGSSVAGSSAIILLAIIFVTVTARQRNYDRLSDTTHKLLRVSDKVENDLVTMESAQRDFLLTGDRLFLEQFNHHHAALNDRLAELASLAQRPEHAGRLTPLRKNLAEWEETVALPQIAAREQGLDPSPMISRNKGTVILGTVRAGLADFDRATADILAQVEADAQMQRMYYVGGGAALCFVAIAFLLASSGYSFAAYRRHLAKVDAAQAQPRAIIASALDAVITVAGDGRIA